MKLKLSTCLIYCLLYTCQSFAQAKETVYFLKNSGSEVDKIEDADFIRVISEPDSGSTLYNLAEYYPNKTPKMIVKTSNGKFPVFEGLCRVYYPSGKRREIATFKGGVKDGDSYEYYKSGKLYLHKTYSAGKEQLVMDCVDSTGNVLLKNGNGTHIIYNNDFKDIIEQGEVKDGLKNGQWRGETKFDKIKIIFNEYYKDGVLVTGVSADPDGVTHQYTQREIKPSFKGGMDGFGRYLADGVRYPAWAKTNHIEGKVIVSFVVEKDGSLADFKIIQNPNDQMSAEAIRILKISPKWVPGVYYGKIVRVSFTVPIVFHL